MIPIKLTLRNFLSYGEASEPLDFTDLHVACLTGSNGGGKSALLDGITWALWGQARAAVDDLVRLGQSSMQVEFDFAFDGAEYRVIRKRTRGRVGQSDLQFQVKGPDHAFRAEVPVARRQPLHMRSRLPHRCSDTRSGDAQSGYADSAAGNGLPTSWPPAQVSALTVRPLGFNTRWISAKMASLSADRLKSPLLTTQSTELSAKGKPSAGAGKKLTLVRPSCRKFVRARSSMSSVQSTPIT